jgi:hypothetical protein
VPSLTDASGGEDVTPSQLWERYPHLYHMAASGSWPSIEKHGLLSTSSLLDLFEVVGQDREKIEARRRPESVALDHPEHERVVIRDQKPISDRKLERCLTDGTSPEEWYRLLNSKIFFWLDRERVEGLRTARAYRDHPQTVITFHTRPIVEAYQERIQLSHMNTGTTSPMAHPRGRETFVSIDAYPFKQRRRVVEFTVERGISDASSFVVNVEDL